jgi:hypothetical protein
VVVVGFCVDASDSGSGDGDDNDDDDDDDDDVDVGGSAVGGAMSMAGWFFFLSWFRRGGLEVEGMVQISPGRYHLVACVSSGKNCVRRNGTRLDLVNCGQQ